MKKKLVKELENYFNKLNKVLTGHALNLKWHLKI